MYSQDLTRITVEFHLDKKFKLARGAHRLDAKHPLIIEALLALKKEERHEGVSMLIEMLRDLGKHGQDSRYLVKMKGSVIRLVLKVAKAFKAGIPIFKEPHHATDEDAGADGSQPRD